VSANACCPDGTDGFGCDPSAVIAPLSRFFLTLGRLDPFDLLKFPDWVPRLTKLTDRKALSVFEDLFDIETLIERRKTLFARNLDAAPRDLLTLLCEAEDPRTGAALSSIEIKANITTFIGAGHETTANALIWSLFLLSFRDLNDSTSSSGASSVLIRVHAGCRSSAVWACCSR